MYKKVEMYRVNTRWKNGYDDRLMGVKFNVLFTDVIRKLPHDTCTLHGVCVCVCE